MTEDDPVIVSDLRDLEHSQLYSVTDVRARFPRGKKASLDGSAQ